MAKTPFAWQLTNFYPDEFSSGYTLRLHGTTLSGHVFDHQFVQVFNLLRKCTSAGQIFVRYLVNAIRDEYLHGSISESCLKLSNASFKAMIAIFMSTALCKYKRKREIMNPLNRGSSLR